MPRYFITVKVNDRHTRTHRQDAKTAQDAIVAALEEGRRLGDPSSHRVTFLTELDERTLKVVGT